MNRKVGSQGAERHPAGGLGCAVADSKVSAGVATIAPT